MNLPLLVIVLLMGSGAALSAVLPPPQMLRAEENYDFLRSLETLASGQRWKMIPLSADRTTYASLGANVRLRVESRRNPAFGATPIDQENVLLYRWMAHAAIRHDDFLTFFGQLKGSYLEHEKLPPGPNDRNRLDLHQAFVEIGPATGPLNFRGGRQELAYGSSRLVGIRNGPNVRLSFDGVRLRTKGENWRADLLLVQPVDVRNSIFSDRRLDQETLWGIYAQLPPFQENGPGLEVYYLGFRDEQAFYRNRRGQEIRHSFGLRWAGRINQWDYDWEPTWQVGEFAGDDIFAWSISTNTGYTFRAVPFNPRLGLKADVISGDRDYEKIGTFNAMYPRGAYFGETGLVGPANLLHLEPSLTIQPAQDWSVTAAVGLFQRFSTDDGLYNPGRRQTRPPNGSTARSIGQQYSLESTWRPHPQWSFLANLSHFSTGDFLRETGPSRPYTLVLFSVDLAL